MADDNIDKLCQACQKIDLYSLFTGPRYSNREHGPEFRQKVTVSVNTLDKVMGNRSCPLCRLIKHQVYDPADSPVSLSEIKVSLVPTRIDNSTDADYLSPQTFAMLATQVICELSPAPGISLRYDRLNRTSGIQLLSPDFVDPARPLLNGFRATTLQNNLKLVFQWIGTCEEHHEEICGSLHISTSVQDPMLHHIRLIDVAKRTVTDYDPATTRYAALSYVWGQDTEAYTKLAHDFWLQENDTGIEVLHLPLAIPKLIEDTFFVCRSIAVPYLWVDIYCVNQADPAKKSADISAMGQIYHHSCITLVAGMTSTLFSGSLTNDIGSVQRSEMIDNRRYITSLPGIFNDMSNSAWLYRGWTFQEGQMAKRIAFFGQYDISFWCSAGQWRESLHSGVFGHNIHIPEVDLTTSSHFALCGSTWLRNTDWDFNEYGSMLAMYSGRKLSFEGDKLNAISGCLNTLANNKGISYVAGLPSADFHYALLWIGEFDQACSGFPSWSWAGWMVEYQTHLLWPHKSAPVVLSSIDDDHFEYKNKRAPRVGLRASFLHPSSLPPKSCFQRLSPIFVSRSKLTVRIQSEVAHFFLQGQAPDFKAIPGCDSGNSSRGLTGSDGSGVEAPPDSDSNVQSSVIWQHSNFLYKVRSCSIHFRDSFNTTYSFSNVSLETRVPLFHIGFPKYLRESTIAWLMRDGIELIKIIEIKYVAGNVVLPFHVVFCMGIDRSGNDSAGARRMGVFYMPKQWWDRARPKEMEVTFV